jgi:hypothetical protein
VAMRLVKNIASGVHSVKYISILHAKQTNILYLDSTNTQNLRGSLSNCNVTKEKNIYNKQKV